MQVSAENMALFIKFQRSGINAMLDPNKTGLEEWVSGREYHSGLYIEYVGHDEWLLTIENSMYETTDLTHLERILFNWALGEGALDDLT